MAEDLRIEAPPKAAVQMGFRERSLEHMSRSVSRNMTRCGLL